MSSIRKYRPSDESSVLSLANKYAAFEGETSSADLTAAAYFPEGFWVAEEDGEIVGYAYGYLKDDVPESVLLRYDATKVAYLASMAVEPKYRGRGIATKLLSRIFEEFRKAGADLVFLDCPGESVDAKKLYDKLGFEVRGFNLMLKLSRPLLGVGSRSEQ